MTDLFTLPEMASFLQQDLDTATATLASSLAHGLVRGYTRQDLTATTYTAAPLRIVRDPSPDATTSWATRLPRWSGGAYCVVIPNRPVTAVTAVAVNGQTYTRGQDWAWDGASPVISLARVALSTDVFQAFPVALVTYTAGYATVPDDLKRVAIAVAARLYENPTSARSEAIDDYQRQHADGLTPLEMAVLDRYRVRAGTLTPR